ncbi:MAG: histidine--tRNA ligase [Myxococcales bacterium]|jgi:histidyl-tRNA synthetase
MAKATAQPPKGTRDFLPLDVRRRDHVTGIIRRVYESYGFEPLETPALERLDTLMGKYGEEGDQLLFKVLLRGQPLVKGLQRAGEHVADEANLVRGRSGVTAPGAEPMLSDMGLRYDLTVPLARVCASYQGKLPAIFKRYQIQPVWRADTPGKGRFREFYQCDVDVVGGDSLVVEAEVLSAGAECLLRLGFDDFAIRLNHRALLRALIEHAGIPLSLETEAIVAVDKMDKVGRDGVARELEQRGIEPAARERLLALLGDDANLEHIARNLADHQGGRAAVADLQELLSLADDLPAGKHLKFDVTLARGLSYYTGCIFEVQVADLAGSIGSGGRYDGLIGLFSGRDAPACGFSLGLERILVVMAERDMFPDSLTHVDLVVAAADAGRLPAALALAAELRASGLRVDLRPKTIRPGKLRQQAEAQGLCGAVWLEGDPASGPRLWLRRSGETARDLTAAQILERVREIDASEAGDK